MKTLAINKMMMLPMMMCMMMHYQEALAKK